MREAARFELGMRWKAGVLEGMVGWPSIEVAVLRTLSVWVSSRSEKRFFYEVEDRGMERKLLQLSSHAPVQTAMPSWSSDCQGGTSVELRKNFGHPFGTLLVQDISCPNCMLQWV